MDGLVPTRHLVDVGVGVAGCAASGAVGGGGKKTLGSEQSVGFQGVAGSCEVVSGAAPCRACRRGQVLSVPDLRRMLWRLVLLVWRGVEHVLSWCGWRRRHQWIAQYCHYRRRQNRYRELQL